MRLPEAAQALPGRPQPILPAAPHFINGHNLTPPYPAESESAVFALGCFWGAERRFWELGDAIFVTAAGYCGGFTANPTYEDVCSGATAHAEAVLVVFDPDRISYSRLLATFWESHDPTQGMRQGHDIGTQYRSAIYSSSEPQHHAALASREVYQKALSREGFGAITTEITRCGPFYFAEDNHQQYLARNPRGYCGRGGTSIRCRLDDNDKAC